MALRTTTLEVQARLEKKEEEKKEELARLIPVITNVSFAPAPQRGDKVLIPISMENIEPGKGELQTGSHLFETIKQLIKIGCDVTVVTTEALQLINKGEAAREDLTEKGRRFREQNTAILAGCTVLNWDEFMAQRKKYPSYEAIKTRLDIAVESNPEFKSNMEETFISYYKRNKKKMGDTSTKEEIAEQIAAAREKSYAVLKTECLGMLTAHEFKYFIYPNPTPVLNFISNKKDNFPDIEAARFSKVKFKTKAEPVITSPRSRAANRLENEMKRVIMDDNLSDDQAYSLTERLATTLFFFKQLRQKKTATYVAPAMRIAMRS